MKNEKKTIPLARHLRPCNLILRIEPSQYTWTHPIIANLTVQFGAHSLWFFPIAA
jgi:hypothetical protein